MIKYKNLTIVGTSHIAKQSLIEVEETIKTENPIYVALELDKDRFTSLLSGERKEIGVGIIKDIGVGGYVLLKIGHYIETKLGASIGSELGGEMMKAADLASKNGYNVALIDQDIRKTLKNFSANFGFKEKILVVWDLIKGFIIREKIEIDLSKVPSSELIMILLERVKRRYPGLYKALVQDRNVYMARRLLRLMDNGSVVAVVGAGHVEGILDEIKRMEKNKNKIDRIGL
jgi:pheromone shutdown-related protein TraB